MNNVIPERRLISLNSKYASRQNGSYLSNVIFNFPNVLSADLDIISVECGVYNGQIPVSFYTIDYRNQVLNYRVNTTNYSVTITQGNYTSTSLFSELQTEFLKNAHSFSISISRASGLVTYQLITAVTLQYFIESGSTAWSALGFVTGSGNVSAVSNIIVSPQMLNLLGIKKLKIYSDALALTSLDSLNLSKTSLVDVIPVNAPAYELVQYINTQATFSKISVEMITSIDIQIKDEDGNFVNFQGINWCLTLALVIYREPSSRKGDLQPLLQNIRIVLQDLENTFHPAGDEVHLEENDHSLQVGDLDILQYQNPDF